MSVYRIVTVPQLVGPRLRGIACDHDGFIATDAHGRLAGLDGVCAAGDATSFPVRQGGLAAQQGDAVAETIAASVGVDVVPELFRPILGGLLLTGGPPRYLQADISGRAGDDSTISGEALWWPPDKLAGRYLAPYLSSQVDDRLKDRGRRATLQVAERGAWIIRLSTVMQQSTSSRTYPDAPVTARPGRAELFERLRLDYCCGGRQTLAEACAKRGIEHDEARAALRALDASAIQSDSWAVLFSHRRNFTPICTTELGYMARIKPEFDRRNTKVIGLSVDPVDNHEKWAHDIAASQSAAPNSAL